MRYDGTDKLSEKEFRKLTGVKRNTFVKMVEILTVAEEAKRKKGGHKSKLSVKNMLLLTLEYIREYRTYFHIAQEFGIHETQALRISRWVEN
ncbi:MAG: transposase family protein, partial [Clostridiales bacterium]|nr:transposase family protein [Clostridiales bacterium]